MEIDVVAKNQLIKIGLKVQYYRKLKNLTQDDLAAATGLSISAISRLENANVYTNSEILTILKIAIALGVEPSKLLEFND